MNVEMFSVQKNISTATDVSNYLLNQLTPFNKAQSAPSSVKFEGSFRF